MKIGKKWKKWKKLKIRKNTKNIKEMKKNQEKSPIECRKITLIRMDYTNYS